MARRTRRSSSKGRKRGVRRKDRQERRQRSEQRAGKRYLNLPDGLQLWEPEEGLNKIEIIPYVVGEGHPAADSGDEWYERSYDVYRQIGPNKQDFLAPAQFDEPDPVTELVAEMNENGADWETQIKPFKAKTRQMFLVYDHKDKDAGVKLYEASYHALGKLISGQIDAADDDEDHKRDFDDPEAGAVLAITFEAKKIGGKGSTPWVAGSNIEFKPRKNGFTGDESLLDHGICLDDLLVHDDYDTIKTAIEGIGTEPKDDDDDEEDERPKRRRKSKPVEDDFDDDDNDEEEKPKRRRRRKPVIEEDDDDDNDEDEDDDDDEEEPVKKRRRRGTATTKTKSRSKSRKKPPVKEEDDDDDWDDDDDDWDDD